MKIASVKRLDRGDFPKDVQDWIEQLLQPLNQFMEQATQALDHRLSFADNWNAKQTTQKLVHDVAFSFENPLGDYRPVWVVPLQALDAKTNAQLVVTGFGWSMKQDGKIQATAQFSGGGTTTSQTKMLVFGG